MEHLEQIGGFKGYHLTVSPSKMYFHPRDEGVRLLFDLSAGMSSLQYRESEAIKVATRLEGATFSNGESYLELLLGLPNPDTFDHSCAAYEVLPTGDMFNMKVLIAQGGKMYRMGQLPFEKTGDMYFFESAGDPIGAAVRFDISETHLAPYIVEREKSPVWSVPTQKSIT